MVLETKINHPTGSTAWFKEICSRIQLEPAKAEDGVIDDQQLKEQCDGAPHTVGGWFDLAVRPDTLNEERRERLDRELQILADKLIEARIS